MKKKRTVILGGGIAGLTAAWELSKQSDRHECTILEKSDRVGGYMQTEIRDGHILESGPRVFKISRNADFLRLIGEVGFSSELIFSSPEANTRYLWKDGRLRSPFLVNFFPLLRAFCTEWRKKGVFTEETVRAFASRRFGSYVADFLFDPLIRGIYAGDSDRLSVDACFPILKQWERERGSVILGALLRKKSAKHSPYPEKGLFSFRNGTGSFIRALQEKLPFPIRLGEEVKKIEQTEGGFLVFGNKGTYEADEVISALPAYVAGNIFSSSENMLSSSFKEIPYVGITSVQSVFSEPVLSHKGFGYLVPSSEDSQILGTLFDSMIFPVQGPSNEDRITVLLKGGEYSEQEALALAEKACRLHLGISVLPKFSLVKAIPRAIPQYEIGHASRIEALLRELPSSVRTVGNYLRGVSVNDTIRYAKAVAGVG